MTTEDPVARWRAEPARQFVERPDRLGRVALWLLVLAGLYLAARILYGLTVPEMLPEKPVPYISQWEYERIEECEWVIAQNQMLYGKALRGLRGSAHPLLHEAQRARWALELVRCERDVRRML